MSIGKALGAIVVGGVAVSVLKKTYKKPRKKRRKKKK